MHKTPSEVQSPRRSKSQRKAAMKDSLSSLPLGEVHVSTPTVKVRVLRAAMRNFQMSRGRLCANHQEHPLETGKRKRKCCLLERNVSVLWRLRYLRSTFNVIMQRVKLFIIYLKCGLIPDHSMRIVRQHQMMTKYCFLEWNRALAS